MNAAYGSRLRIGVILPADNVVTEPELNGLEIAGVSVHAARLVTDDRNAMREDAVRAADALRTAGVDVVGYACSETSAIGAEAAGAFMNRLADAAGAPTVTATAALTALLNELGASRVVMVTPYRARYGTDVEGAYRSRGVDVARAVHHPFGGDDGASEWYATNRQSPDAVAALVRSAGAEDAHAVLLPATNLPTAPVLGPLGAELGRAVISGNQALAWWCLREGGLAEEAELILERPA